VARAKENRRKYHVAIRHPSRRAGREQIRWQGAIMKRAILTCVAVAAAVGGLMALQPSLLPFRHSGMTPAVAQEAAASKPRSIKY
jgi:hypothetical protein